MLKNIDFLKELSLAFGPSGYENEIREIIKREIFSLPDSITEDGVGNLIAYVRGKRSDMRLMISAHMDEVGFMVTGADGCGGLCFTGVGGMDARILCGKRVTIQGNRGQLIKGVISSKPIHMQSRDERSRAPKAENLFIDVGASSDKEALDLAGKGSLAVFDSDFVEFGDGKIKGKALDDRAGCFIMADMLRRIRSIKLRPPCDTYFVFGTREEIGLSGAATAASSISPTHAMVLETTAVSDLPDVPAHKCAARQGDGGVISIIDNGTVYSQELISAAIRTADEKNIRAQIKKYKSGGNDSSHIQKSGSGCKVLALSIPTRYLHSPSCVIAEDDLTAVSELAFALLKTGALLI